MLGREFSPAPLFSGAFGPIYIYILMKARPGKFGFRNHKACFVAATARSLTISSSFVSFFSLEIATSEMCPKNLRTPASHGQAGSPGPGEWVSKHDGCICMTGFCCLTQIVRPWSKGMARQTNWYVWPLSFTWIKSDQVEKKWLVVGSTRSYQDSLGHTP